jgi:hypothetical protein
LSIVLNYYNEFDLITAEVDDKLFDVFLVEISLLTDLMQ